jgi:hypothetical protein
LDHYQDHKRRSRGSIVIGNPVPTSIDQPTDAVLLYGTCPSSLSNIIEKAKEGGCSDEKHSVYSNSVGRVEWKMFFTYLTLGMLSFILPRSAQDSV